MAGKIEAKLAALGITLPTPAAPIANYIPYNISGKLVVISGMAGSKQGWAEAPYLPCPASAADLARNLHHRRPASGRVRPRRW